MVKEIRKQTQVDGYEARKRLKTIVYDRFMTVNSHV